MITLQLKEEPSETNRVTFLWQGMTIYLQTILSRDGEKCFYVKLENAKPVVNGFPGSWAKWIISNSDTASEGAGAFTISNGSVGPATSKNTGER